MVRYGGIGEIGMRKKDHWLYTRYYAMKTRCFNKNFWQYPDYGARGITVCAEWRKNFWNYVAYVESLPGYQDGFTIDRINNEGDYEPGNLRWASVATQNSNRRNVKRWGKGYHRSKNGTWRVNIKIGNGRMSRRCATEEQAIALAEQWRRQFAYTVRSTDADHSQSSLCETFSGVPRCSTTRGDGGGGSCEPPTWEVRCDGDSFQGEH